MKKLLTNLITGLAALALATQAAAQINVSLQPSPQIINVGDPASMDLIVSGLSDFSAPSLGGFDFDLSYNPAIISPVSLPFGNFLDLGTLGSIRFADLSVAGSIHLDEVSFEDPGDLNAAQPDTFTLATLGFIGLAAGISTIDFDFASLSDENGQSITAFSTTGGLIEVTGTPPIPDAGSTACLLLLGVASVLALRRFPQVTSERASGKSNFWCF